MRVSIELRLLAGLFRDPGLAVIASLELG